MPKLTNFVQIVKGALQTMYMNSMNFGKVNTSMYTYKQIYFNSNTYMYFLSQPDQTNMAIKRQIIRDQEVI